MAAAYAEELFNFPDVWDFILSEEPTLKERVLAFFTGAEKRYSFDERMKHSARRWLARYKKLFSEVSAANKGASAAVNGAPSDTVKIINRIGKIIEPETDSRGGFDIRPNDSVKVKTIGRMVDDGVRAKLKGVAEDGKKIYESNFPKGTPKRAKSERILAYIRDIWSKKPIPLVITNGETSRTILAQFDPTIDETKTEPTDASKIAGGNRHGNATEKRVTLDLADDYYEIASEAKYNYSKEETGKSSETHKDVKMWHYFVNEIYFAEQGEEIYTPYTVTINVKEKADGEYVYSFNAEKESSTQRTLHAAGSTRKGTNGELFIDSIPDSSEKSNSFDKKTSKDFNSGKRSALKKTKNDILATPLIGIDEREDLARVLLRDARDESERISIGRYIEDLHAMESVMVERSDLIHEYKKNRDSIKALYKGVRTKKGRKEVAASKEMSALREAQGVLEERIELIENEISRRDVALFELAAMQPVRELVKRSYKLGVSDGATARVTPGVIKKRLAAMLHSKCFSLGDAKEIIAEIDRKYRIDGDWTVKSELARRLWVTLNESEDRVTQKKALSAFAEEVLKNVYGKRTRGQKADIAFVRRVEKYKGRIVFDEHERNIIKKYYTDEADNIFDVWEYKGDKSVKPKNLGDVLWDAGQIKKYEHYALFENSAPSDRADTFYELLGEFEMHESRVEELKASSKSDRAGILDTLWRGFEDGGRETYKAKYEDLSKNRKIFNEIERRLRTPKALKIPEKSAFSRLLVWQGCGNGVKYLSRKQLNSNQSVVKSEK